MVVLAWPALYALSFAVSAFAASNATSESLSLTSTPSGTSLRSDASHTPSATSTITSTSAPSPSTNVAVPSSSPSTNATQPPATPSLNPSTQSDIQTMTQRRLSFIVAGATQASSIPQWLSTLGSDGKWPASEIDYTVGCDARPANWPIQDHWNRILTLSAAYHGGLADAEQYVHDTSVLSAISKAMDFWFANVFQNVACLDSGGTDACPCGTPGFWNTNWFSNIILIPNLVGQSCLLVSDKLTETQASNCTYITGLTYGTFGHSVHNLGIATGANLLDIAKIGIDQGLRNMNESIISDAYSRIHNEVIIENKVKADGIRADGSFGQHSGVIYNGNYGKDFANDVLFLEIVAGGTQFAAGDATKSAFSTLIDSDQWMIVRNVLTGVLHWDFSVLGRFISFPVADAQATGSIKINITQIQDLGNEWNSDVLKNAYANLSKNTTNANVGSFTGNKMFYANDYMVQRGPGYVTSVRMYSNRTKNTECLNNQNILGFHLSDGTVYTYLQGNEYEDIAASWDWNLIPGTTTDYGATPLSCSTVEHTGLHAFVGGVSDGKIGAAAMQFTSPTTKALTWQKAWFFLDNDVQHVMIPAINHTTTNASVYSVLDQKRLNGPVIVNGVQTTQLSNAAQPRTLWHDNVGYVFSPNPVGPSAALNVQTGPKTGDWAAIGISTQGNATVDLFAAYLNHGTGPNFTPLSYTTLPAVDQAKFTTKSAQLKLQDVRNDQIISAAYDQAHNVLAAVFWDTAGGSFSFTPALLAAPITVASNGNGAILYRIDTGEVTVSDPSQTRSNLQVTFTAGNGAKPSLWGSSSKQVNVSFPAGGVAGSSVTQKL